MFQHSILRHLMSTCVFAAPAEVGSAPSKAKAKPSVPAAGKSPFAHLARNAPRAAEDEKDEKDESASEDEECEEDDEDTENEKKTKKTKKAKKAKKAEEDDDDADAAEDDEEDGDEDMSEGDDDSDKDDDAKAATRAARARERGRITAIVTSKAGKANPVAAMEIACATSMSRRQAIGLLQAMGAPAASAKSSDSLRSRMANEAQPDVGSGDGEQVAPNLAQQIILAGKKRRGEV
jgi:hypothetical protein